MNYSHFLNRGYLRSPQGGVNGAGACGSGDSPNRSLYASGPDSFDDTSIMVLYGFLNNSRESKHGDNDYSPASIAFLRTPDHSSIATNPNESQPTPTTTVDGSSADGKWSDGSGDANRNITWSELTKKLKETSWQPLEGAEPRADMSRIYANHVFNFFGLSHIEHTGFLWHRVSTTIVCLCYEGVFMFGAGFEYACLVAKTCKGALRYMLDVNVGCEGEVRAGVDRYYREGVESFDIFLEYKKMMESQGQGWMI